MNRLTTELYNLYWEELYSLSDIAVRHDVCPMTVLNRMKRAGVPRRSSAEALKVERCRLKKSKSRKRFHDSNPNFKKRENAPAWNGGICKDIQSGHVKVYFPDHPFASKRGYVRQHRLVMEEMLGRYLFPQEVVLHKDKDGGNNDPENLKLFKSSSTMTSYLNTLKRKN